MKEIIEQLVKEWYEREQILPYDINNGSCEDFTGEIYERHLETNDEIKSTYIYTEDIHNFWGESGWKRNYTLKQLGSKKPKNLNMHDLGGHCWIFYNGKHYDAECSDGVKNLFDLPIFKKVIDKINLEKE